VVQGLGQLLDQGITGIVHLGGPQRLSRYDFGLQMAEAFNFSPTVLRPCSQASVAHPAPRPADVSLHSEKAFQLGYAPRAVATALRAIAAQRIATASWQGT
jgi:dTDP-4-dehydrorhamnose reductase